MYTGRKKRDVMAMYSEVSMYVLIGKRVKGNKKKERKRHDQPTSFARKKEVLLPLFRTWRA